MGQVGPMLWSQRYPMDGGQLGHMPGLQREAMRFPADFSYLLVIQPFKGEKNHLKSPLIDEMILLNQHFDRKDN